MILQCPECNARYAVPDSAIGTQGRTVRCAKCKHSWHQDGITPQAKDDLDQMLSNINAAVENTDAEEDAPKRRKKHRRNLPAVQKKYDLVPGWRSFVVAMNVAAVAMVLLLIYPQIYGQPRSTDLAIADAGMIKLAEDKTLAYDLTGKIVNKTDTMHKVPTLRITLVDQHGNALQFWDFTSPGSYLKPGEALPFTTGKLPVEFSRADRFVMEIGTPLELLFRRPPQ